MWGDIINEHYKYDIIRKSDNGKRKMSLIEYTVNINGIDVNAPLY